MLTTNGLTKTLEIGASGAGFTDLPGVDGKRHSLKDYADAKILLIVFTANRIAKPPRRTRSGSSKLSLTIRTRASRWWRLARTIRRL